MPTTQRVELIYKEEFAKAGLDKNIETFVIHVSSLSIQLKMTIYIARKVQIASLLAKKVGVLAKYSDFVHLFLEKLANILLEQTKVNEHAIELKQGK